MGATEAGEGEDGRMKSAVGIGTLLADILGDTIRAPLTEDPEFEYEPCHRLAKIAESRHTDKNEDAKKEFVATKEYVDTRDITDFSLLEGVVFRPRLKKRLLTESWNHNTSDKGISESRSMIDSG